MKIQVMLACVLLCGQVEGFVPSIPKIQLCKAGVKVCFNDAQCTAGEKCKKSGIVGCCEAPAVVVPVLPTPVDCRKTGCKEGEFCRPALMGRSCSTFMYTCAAYRKAGEVCSRRGLLCTFERCESGLTCVGDARLPDLPGKCEKPDCRLNACEAGYHCRQQNDGTKCLSAELPFVCVPYAKSGDDCGGSADACLQEKCNPATDTCEQFFRGDKKICMRKPGSIPPSLPCPNGCPSGQYCTAENCISSAPAECRAYGQLGDSCDEESSSLSGLRRCQTRKCGSGLECKEAKCQEKVPPADPFICTRKLDACPSNTYCTHRIEDGKCLGSEWGMECRPFNNLAATYCSGPGDSCLYTVCSPSLYCYKAPNSQYGRCIQPLIPRNVVP